MKCFYYLPSLILVLNLYTQRPQDILQLLLDSEVCENQLVSSQCEPQQLKEQQNHFMDKIVNFGAKKLSIEVTNLF